MTYGIGKDNAEMFFYSNRHLLGGTPSGVVLDFHGLNGGTDLLREDPDYARRLAADGVLYLFPYNGPWSWMNDTAVKTVDGILDAVIEKYEYDPAIPVVSTGGSMGGMAALTYARYSRHHITACAANCPVCDLPFHYTERPDLPRTFLCAFGHYDMPLKDALETASPLHQAAHFPRVPYYIVHGGADTAVDKTKHSDRLVAALRAAGHQVEYHEIPDMTHCSLSEEEWNAYVGFASAHARG